MKAFFHIIISSFEPAFFLSYFYIFPFTFLFSFPLKILIKKTAIKILEKVSKYNLMFDLFLLVGSCQYLQFARLMQGRLYVGE
jgi:hypothetical protein